MMGPSLRIPSRLKYFIGVYPGAPYLWKPEFRGVFVSMLKTNPCDPPSSPSHGMRALIWRLGVPNVGGAPLKERL